jgi:hypothetical protein
VRALRNGHSDGAESDDRHRLAAQQPGPIDLAELRLNPAAIALREDRQIQPASQGEQASHDLLGHRNSLHASAVGDDDFSAREFVKRKQVADSRGGRVDPAELRCR